MQTVKPITGLGDVQRKYLACAIDVSDPTLTPPVPEYIVVGYRITDSALETNPDTETGTDINGRTFGSVNALELTQTFEPHRLTTGVIGKIGARLISHTRYKELEMFSQFKAILIWGMLSPDGGPYEADLYEGCTITPNSFGGEAWVDAPFTIVFAGNVTRGTVTSLIDSTTFTQTI